MRHRLSPTFREVVAAADAPLVGMWVCSGSPLAAEICAGSGVDWLLIDMEHSPNSAPSVMSQLQATAGYDVAVLVRVPSHDVRDIGPVLDAGAQNLIVPMVSSAAEARAVVEAVRYPPAGRRGVGSALARASRWNRVDDYLATASASISLTVQIETREGVEAVEEIAAIDGVDAVFIGPSDLAASMGMLGRQSDPSVVDAARRCVAAVHRAGKPVGINAFDPYVARGYRDMGVDFVAVGADVAVLARGSEALAATLRARDGEERSSY